MRKFDLRIIDPPKIFESSANPKAGDVMRAAPIAVLLTGKGAPTEICRLYGYLMLLGQNLEFELRECLISMQFSFQLRSITPRFSGSPEKTKFENLIKMLSTQLNLEHPPTKKFVDELHRARKFRNRLAHGFLSPSESAYLVTHRGQQALLHQLKLAEKIFFPLIMIIGHIGRGYAADCGITDELIERRRKAWNAEQRQIEKDIQDILDEDQV